MVFNFGTLPHQKKNRILTLEVTLPPGGTRGDTLQLVAALRGLETKQWQMSSRSFKAAVTNLTAFSYQFPVICLRLFSCFFGREVVKNEVVSFGKLPCPLNNPAHRYL